MRNKLALFASILILTSSCATEELTPDLMATAPTQEVENYTAADFQAQSTANSNKQTISQAVNILTESFGDDVEKTLISKSSAVTSDLKTKGGMIFNLLNKSKLAQKVGYLVADYPVRAQFNKKSKPDNLPRISNESIKELQSVLKPGDLILCGNNGSFIHAILYFGNDVIVHALATKGKDRPFLGVVRETLEEYLFRGERDKFLVLRPKTPATPEDLQKVAEYANAQVGKSYDTLFLLNSDTRFYCTELVYNSIMKMSTPPRIYPHKQSFGWQLITNEDIMDSPDLETVWSLNVQRPATGQRHTY